MAKGAAPGERRGGRAKGTPNKRRAVLMSAKRRNGLQPVDYLLSVMADEAVSLPIRVDAAKAVAPYLHPRLSTVELGGKKDAPIQITISPTDDAL